MPIPVIGLHNEDKVFVNGSCVLNEERFILIGSFVAFFIPLVIMVVTYGLTIQVLQRQATVFLCNAKTSPQQPLQPPASEIHLNAPPNLPDPPGELPTSHFSIGGATLPGGRFVPRMVSFHPPEKKQGGE